MLRTDKSFDEQAPLAEKEWTIMVYMAGDNNLSEDMVRSIIEMKKKIAEVGSTNFPDGNTSLNNVNFVVEFDGEHPFVPIKRYNLTYSTCNDYPSTSDSRDIEEQSTTMDSTSPASMESHLRSFVEHSVKIYPAKHYPLILSGHSDSFLGRTLLLDENPSGVVTLKGIAKILKDVKFPINNKIDILGFDSCVMNSIEVLYEFKDVAHACIGSQGNIPNFTWDYGSIAERLMLLNSKDLTTNKIVKEIKESLKSYNRGFAFGGRSLDFSCVQLADLDEIADAANSLSSVIVILIFVFGRDATNSKVEGTSYVVSQMLAVLLRAHWNCQTYLFDQMIDVVDFCGRLRCECERIREDLPSVTAEPEKLKKQSQLILCLHLLEHYAAKLQKSVKSENGMYIGADYQFSNGLSLFYPWSCLGFFMSLGRYRELNFVKDNGSLFFFLLFCTVLTARPDQCIDLVPRNKTEVRPEINDLLTKIGDILNSRLMPLSPDAWLEVLDRLDFKLLTVEMINRWFALQPVLNPPHSKLNPPHSKGMDAYYEYFGRTNNIFPILNVEDDFPPNDYIPAEIQESKDISSKDPCVKG